MNRHDIGTRDSLRLPEEMGNMQQVAAIVFQNAVELKKASDGKFIGLSGNGNEVWRQGTDVGQPARDAEKYVFVFPVQPCQSADRVAGVCSHTKIGNAPDVDRNSHRW